MSTLALSGSEASSARGAGVAGYLDLIVLAIAVPVFFVADLPLVGLAAIAAAWLVQRAIQSWAGKRVAAELAAGNRRPAVAVKAWSTMGRVWLVAGVVLAVGLIAEREDGLAAAVLAAALFTTYFAGEAIRHALGTGSDR